MKKLLTLLLMLSCIAGYACAEEAPALPQAVLDLCAAAHPGYEIAKHDGWGDNSRGQFALILSKDGDNILCMAEKAQDDASYVLSIDNTNAVYDGGVLPSVLIDTGGDSLWYTYVDRMEDSSAHYNAFKSEGQWGVVSVLSYWPKEDGFTGMMSSVSNGTLCYEETDEDENENIRSRWTYTPVYADEAFEESLLLQNFNINAFDPDPRDGLYPLMNSEAFVRSQSVTGETIKDMDISRVHAARLFEMSGGDSLVRVDEWNGVFYPAADDAAAMLRFAGKAVLDTYHAGEGEVFVNSGAMMYSVKRVDEGSWVLRGVDAENGVRMIGPDYAAPEGQSIVHRNDGYVYGASPWDSLPGRQVTLAPSYEEMHAQIDQSAYALVHNPNPADRLHLRAKPDKGSKSYGKFYNRTPVLVLERGDTWTKVQIGRGGAAMTGYMMTQFLIFGEEEKAALACAFPQKQLLESHPHGVHMYSAPESGAVTERMFAYESHDFIIGVHGDDWYIVLRADGAVGYVPQHAFWDGNG